MGIEVDQSNKIERTSKDTVLAMSKLERSLVIPANVKREVLAVLRGRGKSRNVACCQLFAAGIFILLRPHLREITKRREQVVIDTEYTGHEDKIKGMLLRCIRGEGHDVPKDRIYFAKVGKSSQSHQIAWRVQHGLTSADSVVSLDEILQLL